MTALRTLQSTMSESVVKSTFSLRIIDPVECNCAFFKCYSISGHHDGKKGMGSQSLKPSDVPVEKVHCS